MTTYIQAIGWGFPNVQCHAVGDGSIYESTLVGNANRPPRNLGISKLLQNLLDLGLVNDLLELTLDDTHR